jgi:hypothetical protein
LITPAIIMTYRNNECNTTTVIGRCGCCVGLAGMLSDVFFTDPPYAPQAPGVSILYSLEFCVSGIFDLRTRKDENYEYKWYGFA